MFHHNNRPRGLINAASERGEAQLCTDSDFPRGGLFCIDVSRTFPDREFPGKFLKSHSQEIFLYSWEFREIEIEKNAASLEQHQAHFAILFANS